MRFCWWVLAVLTVVLLANDLPAQSPDYTQYSLDDRLASSTVYNAIQDRDGFIWFATESGVSRFDGTQFENFTVRDGLAGNDVLRLYEDHAGRIWCLAFNPGVCFFEKGRFHNPQTDPWLGKAKARNFFISLVEDVHGDVWLADDGGSLFRLNADRETVEDSLFSQVVPSGLWGFFLDAAGEAVAVCNSFAQPLSVGKQAIAIDPPMNNWLATRVAKLKGDAAICAMGNKATVISSGIAHPMTLPSAFAAADILCASLDRAGNLWFGTRDGALMLSEFIWMDSSYSYRELRHFLPGKTITSILEDHEGNHWMTSLGEGVFVFASIHALTYKPLPDQGSTFVNKVFVDSRGTVWVGFDRSNYGKFRGGKLEIHQIPRKGNGRGRVNDIFEDQDGNVFLATDETIMIEEPSGKIHYHQPYAKAVAQLPNGDYYISHGWQINRVKKGPPSKFQEAYALGRSSHDHQISTRASSLAATPDGKLLLGTLHGLFEAEGGQMHIVAGVPVEEISSVHVMPNGRVWLSTLAHGVGYYEGGKYRPLTQDLPSAGICQELAIDRDGVVYVATNRGLARIAPVDGLATQFQTREFGKSYGLASDEVRSVATSAGNVYVATAKGLTVIPETFLTGEQPPVRLHARAFTAAGRELPLNGAPLQLAADDNQLSLTFTGISFRNAANVRFAFALSKDQAQVGWTPTSSRRLDFPYLRPGDYRLQLVAMIEGLPATRDMVTLDFRVLPSFWETNFSRFLIFLLAVGVVVGIASWVLRRRRQQEKLRAANHKRIAELEQKALRAQMNPHFIFNSLNSIERFYITNRLEEANLFIADFSELIRAVLDFSTQTSITLAEEIRLVELVLTLESHRMDHRFDFELEIDPQIDLEGTLIPPMVLQPFIENAIWHGVSLLEERKGRIVLRVKGHPQGTQITVLDNGIGRKKSTELKLKYRKKHHSRGIQITAERFDLLNLDLVGKPNYAIQFQDLADAEGNGLGTEVTIFVPFPPND